MEEKDLFSEEEIREYISKHKKMVITPKEVMRYWRKKGWKTQEGHYVKEISSAVSCLNGIKIQSARAMKRKQKKAAKQAQKLQQEIIKTLPFEPYDEQLKRNEWKKFREFIFAVRGRKCEKCWATTNLQIHHLHYISGRLAWEYLPFDVMVVCGDCHQKIHGLK